MPNQTKKLNRLTWNSQGRGKRRKEVVGSARVARGARSARGARGAGSARGARGARGARSGSDNWIHLFARSKRANRIHHPLDLYQQNLTTFYESILS